MTELALTKEEVIRLGKILKTKEAVLRHFAKSIIAESPTFAFAVTLQGPRHSRPVSAMEQALFFYCVCKIRQKFHHRVKPHLRNRVGTLFRYFV